MIKRKIKKKIIKRRKNPSWLDIIENASNRTIFFAQAIKQGDPEQLARALVYNDENEICDDCKFEKWDCKCEGGREFKLDKLGKRTYDPCEECQLNYCLCDYELDINSSPEKVQKVAIKLAKEQLTKQELKDLAILLK